jgi:hypothetical protein
MAGQLISSLPNLTVVVENDELVIGNSLNSGVHYRIKLSVLLDFILNSGLATGIAMQAPGGDIGQLSIDDEGLLNITFPYTP